MYNTGDWFRVHLQIGPEMPNWYDVISLILPKAQGRGSGGEVICFNDYVGTRLSMQLTMVYLLLTVRILRMKL